MAKVFISYRRDDARYPANELYRELSQHVLNPETDIFLDVDSILLGLDFVEFVDGKLAECEVLLALIGHDWLEALDTSGCRRLEDPNDYVRIEIVTALKRRIPVVPVLLDGAPMPAEGRLPDDLKPLVRRQAEVIRLNTFRADVERLVKRLPVRLNSMPKSMAKSTPPSRPVRTKRPSRAPLWAGLAVLVAVGIGVGLYLTDPSSWQRASVQATRGSETRTSTPIIPVSPTGGYNYYGGYDNTLDGAEARRLYTKACDDGDALGCGNLGVVYANGDGVTQDYTEARRFFNKACNGGAAWSCRDLGLVYYYGHGVVQDYAEARRLFTKACDGGDASGCG
ncbi:MAG: toll/interleukin-1 receptor domain-containing protein, partial [Hyphomonas sp.]|nr:toll/interleukin-1 receptor domain-containing protein [Hyphomonas sp.]